MSSQQHLMINGEEKANAPRFADSRKPTAADWIAEIKRIWARGPASTLELARLICMIRHQLPRGEWTALWRSGEMPFGRRKGYMLLRIANGLGWANVQTFAHLPTGWSILHQLARLDRQTL